MELTASIVSPYLAEITVNPMYTAIIPTDRSTRSRFIRKNDGAWTWSTAGAAVNTELGVFV